MVNAGARLDRLPISPFHKRMLWLIGLGGLFDSFDIYLGGSVLAARHSSAACDWLSARFMAPSA